MKFTCLNIDLLRIIKDSSKCCGNNEAFLGVLVHANNNKIKFVSTNGSRLSVLHLPISNVIDSPKNEIKKIFSPNDLKSILPFLKSKINKTVTIELLPESGLSFLANCNKIILNNYINGKYPDYTKLIDSFEQKDEYQKVTFNQEYLKDCGEIFSEPLHQGISIYKKKDDNLSGVYLKRNRKYNNDCDNDFILLMPIQPR